MTNRPTVTPEYMITLDDGRELPAHVVTELLLLSVRGDHWGDLQACPEVSVQQGGRILGRFQIDDLEQECAPAGLIEVHMRRTK